MSELKKEIEEYIKYKISDRQIRAIAFGYDDACREMEEITDELQQILEGDISYLNDFENKR